MSERTFHAARIAASLWLILASQSARSDERIETLTVVASRIPVTSTAAAVPVERIERTEIEAHAPPDLAALLTGRRGFTVARAGGSGQLTEVRLRGAEANHLKVRIDGIAVNDPATGDNVDFAQLPLLGVERLEILRGAQSALWGSDALAGVIHLDTTPAPGARRREAVLASGSFDTRALAFDVATADASRHVAAGARRLDTDGTNVALEGTEDDGYRNTTWYANAGYRGERTALRAVVRGLTAETEFDPTPFPSFLPADGDLEQRTQHLLGGVEAAFGLDTRLPQRLRANLLETENATREDGLRTGSADGRRAHVEWQSDYFFGGSEAASATLALEHTRETFHQRGTASPLGDPNQNQSMDTTAVVTEWRTRLAAASLSASLRHDSMSELRDATTYRLAGRLPVADATVVFASVGTGVKKPTFTERFGFFPDTFIGNPDLDVERSTSYTLAVEQRITEALQGGLSLFHDRLEDEIESFVFDADQGGFTARNATGRSRRDGVEPWLTWQATQALTVAADYTFLDASEPDDGGQVREVRRARHTGALRLDWRIDATLAVAAGVVYVGDRRDLDFSTFPATRARLHDYTLLHCTARWQPAAPLELALRVDNLTDVDYEDVFGYRTPGRSVTFILHGRL
jgi:vitamin B12 transporter